jgi:magnesium-protoporphyrin IX monomethyl ester (oxidative) cyclase
MYPVQTRAPVATAEPPAVPIINEVTRQAQQDAMLSPRFYTTDFEEMNRIDVSPMREEWDALLEEFRSDPNKGHFKRTAEFESSFPDMPVRQEFIDFLVSSITAEFSGCVLYAEVVKRVKNPDVKALFGYMSRDEGRHAGFINGTLKEMDVGVDLSFLTKAKKYTYFKPKFIYYATYLSEKIGYARYITIYRKLEENPDGRIHPIFQWFENWCNDEFRHGEALAVLMRTQPELLAGRNKLWIRFFLLAVYCTMFVRDHLRGDFYRALGLDPTEYDLAVFRITNDVSRQVFPLALDVENPKFLRRMHRMARNTERIGRTREEGGFVNRIRRGALMLGNALTFAQLYLMRALPNTPPANVRMQPTY